MYHQSTPHVNTYLHMHLQTFNHTACIAPSTSLYNTSCPPNALNLDFLHLPGTLTSHTLKAKLGGSGDHPVILYHFLRKCNYFFWRCGLHGCGSIHEHAAHGIPAEPRQCSMVTTPSPALVYNGGS